MNFRTSKCNHGEKGMCINCMINKNKIEKKVQQTIKKAPILQCKHPPHMKCLRCLPQDYNKNVCDHPDYQKCKKCENYLKYDRFIYYLQNLNNDCSHKKPCYKCVPPLSRKSYFIDKSCKNHQPYPLAQCESCMAPVLTVGKQKYSHVSKVIIQTTSIYRIIDSNLYAVLLGYTKEDIVYVQDLFFPSEQQRGDNYLTPEISTQLNYIFQQFNMRVVGILYASNITGFNLMISSLFQQKFIEFDQGHQISKFITMRLHLDQNQTGQPHFQCFMVSDQFQSFHKNGLIYEKQILNQNAFNLITQPPNQLSGVPTFLRQGVETDVLFYKEVIVWIQTEAEQNFFEQKFMLLYPFFKLENQKLQDMKRYMELNEDPLQKYKNIQFLIHLHYLFGMQCVKIFLDDFFYQAPNEFLSQKIRLQETIEIGKLKEFENPSIYKNYTNFD